MPLGTAQPAGPRYAILGLLLALTVLIRLPILVEPWGADQAGFGQVAKGILEGKVPYKDNYDLTAYGVFFTFALFFKLFGMTMVSAHIGHLLVSAVTMNSSPGLAATERLPIWTVRPGSSTTHISSRIWW